MTGTRHSELPDGFEELGLTGIDFSNPLGETLDGAINAMTAELIAGIEDDRTDGLRPRRMLYISRGNGKVRWFFDPALGHYVQKDEYAENVPQAILDACERLGWTGIVLYSGRSLEFDQDHPSFSTLYPDTAYELDYTRLARAAQLRAATAGEFGRRWDQVRRDPAWQKAFSFRGVDFHDQLEPTLETITGPMSASYVSEYARWTAVLKAFQPEIVVGGRLDSNTPLLRAASEQGVLSANIKLGIGEEMLAPFFQRTADGEFDAPSMPDLQLVWGQRQADMLDERMSGHPSVWAAVGRTRNDSFVGTSSATDDAPKETLKSHLGLPDEARIIVYGANHRSFFARDAGDENGQCCFSWVTYSDNLEVLEAVAQARADTHVVVKPHPSDDIPRITEFVETLSERVHVVTNEAGLHNSVILGDSDIFVSSVTSMFSEAVASDCLSINLWADDVNFLYETARRDIFDAMAVTVQSSEALAETVGHYLDDETARAAMLGELNAGLREYFGEVDGRNAERAVYAMVQEAAARKPELTEALQALPDPDEGVTAP